MPLRTCMEAHTHREYLTWMHWLEKQWNEPDRTEYYLMRIAQRVQQVLSKNPNSVTLDHQRVGFSRKEIVRPKMTLEAATEASKRKWCAIAGLKYGNRNGT